MVHRCEQPGPEDIGTIPTIIRFTMGSLPAKITRTFPSEMGFRGTWRPYQARLLNQLDLYLADRRLHVVAPPGSGKTLFGIEVVRRLDQPALILVPTLAIRNQWAERVIQQFLPDGAPQPDWMSTDMQRPELLTIVTYQAMHALISGESDPGEDDSKEADTRIPGSTNGGGNGTAKPAAEGEWVNALSAVKTLVVDEAHHLKAEWWKTLTTLTNRLKPAIVALTATPPYDVSPYEWQRYEDLCGSVDAEVSVPELVLQGDVCPHQDYVYFSAPASQEQKMILDFRAAVETFCEDLRKNHEFTKAVASHPWITNTKGCIEEILDDPEYLSSMAVYLNAMHEQLPREVRRCLGVSSKSIPALNLEWLEVLLTHSLYADADRYKGINDVLKAIRHELSRIGALERRKVVLRNPADHAKLLTTSKTKLHSIEEIVRVEADAQKDAMRCVVLTDFIRKAELPNSVADESEFEELGAVPIFETLRRANMPFVRLGVLCGSLIIVPRSCKEFLARTASQMGIHEQLIAFQSLSHDPEYLVVEVAGASSERAVGLITSIFEQGAITVLVGTKSLLGEGWDAPAINTLVLASFVGSYVLSNQMRGRSIRIHPARPTKTANIWHLVCVEPGPFGPGEDYAVLTRRCNAFAGVSAISKTIENGAERLGIGHPPYTESQMADLNAQTIRHALDRDRVHVAWSEALALGSLRQMTEGLKLQESLPRGFVFRNTIGVLLVQAGLLFVTVLSELMRRLHLRDGQDPLVYVEVIVGLAAAVSLPWALLALWRFIRHGTPERSLTQIGTVLLQALAYEGSVETALPELGVNAERNQDGSVYCWLSGGSRREQSIFVRGLRELLGPIDNPRYLLARRQLWGFFGEDYFAVPDMFARKKAFAEVFAKKWHTRVGAARLVYTRTEDGRKILLRARTHSLSGAFQNRAERKSCWK